MENNVTAECITLTLARLPPHYHCSPGLLNSVVLGRPGALPILMACARQSTTWCLILKSAWPLWRGATFGRWQPQTCLLAGNMWPANGAKEQQQQKAPNNWGDMLKDSQQGRVSPRAEQRIDSLPSLMHRTDFLQHLDRNQILQW